MTQFQKSDMDAPPHDLMRIWVTPVSQWDVFPTRIYVEAACFDESGKRVHTAIHTRFNYLDVPKALAVCKDFHYILGILASEKLANKPVRCEVVVNDFLSFAFITRQIEPARKDQKTWISKAFSKARKTGIPIKVVLGDPSAVEEYRAHSEVVSEDVAPSLESTGDLTRKFVREESKCRK